MHFIVSLSFLFDLIHLVLLKVSHSIHNISSHLEHLIHSECLILPRASHPTESISFHSQHPIKSISLHWKHLILLFFHFNSSSHPTTVHLILPQTFHPIKSISSQRYASPFYFTIGHLMRHDARYMFGLIFWVDVGTCNHAIELGSQVHVRSHVLGGFSGIYNHLILFWVGSDGH